MSGFYQRKGADGVLRDGEIHFFAGQGEGKYAAGEVLTGAYGAPLEPSWASNIAVVDWNGDGTLDLLVGTGEGAVRFFANRGKMTFAPPVDLQTSDGEELSFHDGSPCVVDWDGDGIQDLVLGEAYGSVQFFNAGKPEQGGLPSLAPAVELLPVFATHGVTEVKSGFYMLVVEDPARPTARPFGRVRPTVVDWNGDGKLDLVLGDVVTLRYYRSLSPAESEAKQQLVRQLAAVRAELDAIETQLVQLAAGTVKRAGATLGNSKALRDAYVSLNKASAEWREAEGRQAVLEGELSKFHAPMEAGRKSPLHGFVWVYLRR